MVVSRGCTDLLRAENCSLSQMATPFRSLALQILLDVDVAGYTLNA